jgi:hypothetical protein
MLTAIGESVLEVFPEDSWKTHTHMQTHDSHACLLIHLSIHPPVENCVGAKDVAQWPHLGTYLVYRGPWN